VDEFNGTPSENFVSLEDAYKTMEDWLHTYLGDFEIERDVRPFQLVYRPFNVYLIDIGGYSAGVKHTFMTQLSGVMESRSSRLYLFWTGECWESFESNNAGLIEYCNCINCCDCDLEKISRILLDM
jgi:hypothetical protein